VSTKLLEKAVEVSSSTVSDAVTAQAILFVGRFGRNPQRENLFLDQFKSQRSYVVQRAVLIAIQELPTEARDRFYARALDLIPEHKELIEYLQSLAAGAVDYGTKKRSARVPKETEPEFKSTLLRGVGLVGGEVKRFRLTVSDYQYD
jgi:hypothetical protein